MKIKNKNQLLTCLIAAGHLCSDINQGALSAILPFLIAVHHYSYATSATLVMAANIAGSIIQPVFGHMADKKNQPWTMTLGLLLAGGGMALTGFMPNFIGICLSVIVSGVGIAMFHPQAAKLVNQLSVKGQEAKNISIFSFGGNLGFTFGPLLATTSLTAFGIKGSFIFIVPQIIISILLFVTRHHLKQINANDISVTKKENYVVKKDYWYAFALLCVVIFGRSIILYGLNTFLSLYWISVLGQSKVMANTVLSIFYAIGALATLFGGRIADRIGIHRMIRFSFTLLFPSILFFVMSPNILLASLAIIPMAIALSLGYSPIVVLGQKYLPNHLGFASGITLGLAISIGGIVTPILGKIADYFSVSVAIFVIAIVAIIPMVSSYFLPKTEQNI